MANNRANCDISQRAQRTSSEGDEITVVLEMKQLHKYIFTSKIASIFLILIVCALYIVSLSLSLLLLPRRDDDCGNVMILHGSDHRTHQVSVGIDDAAVVADIQDDLEYCSKNNFVERKFKMRFKHRSLRRPYSISPVDFGADQNGDPASTTSIQRNIRKSCSTVNELLQAIQFGQRYWDSIEGIDSDASSSFQKTDRKRKWIREVLPDHKNISAWLKIEKLPSTFVPHQCDIPRLTTTKICDILNMFSNVVMLGDSLSRHVQSGLWIGLQNDFVNGGIVSDNPLSHHCRCDGQFSENRECRKFSSTFANFVPYTQNLCPRLNPENQVRVIYHHSPFDGPYNFAANGTDMDCEKRKNRGLLLILQGGLHFKTNASATFDKVVLETMSHPIVRKCASLNKLYVIWNGYSAHSPQSTQKYPHQNYTNALRFNSNMEELFQFSYGQGGNVPHQQSQTGSVMQMMGMMNWMNFTQAAQTSDGMHYLSQVNYFKAQYTLYLAELMKKERRIFHY